MRKESWAWWHMPTIPASGELKQEDWKVKASLGYVMKPYPCYPPKHAKTTRVGDTALHWGLKALPVLL